MLSWVQPGAFSPLSTLLLPLCVCVLQSPGRRHPPSFTERGQLLVLQGQEGGLIGRRGLEAVPLLLLLLMLLPLFSLGTHTHTHEH